MKLIGITGGSGTGKSTAARFLKNLGYAVIDSDKIAHEIDAFCEILSVFGVDAINKYDATVNRKYLRQLIISDPTAKKKLEDIMVPKVMSEVVRQVEALNSSGRLLAFFDCPMLFETGAHSFVNSIICVTAPYDLRVQRIMARDNVTRESAEGLFALQMPDADKIGMSDFIINNGGTERDLIAETITVLHHIHKGLID